MRARAKLITVARVFHMQRCTNRADALPLLPHSAVSAPLVHAATLMPPRNDTCTGSGSRRVLPRPIDFQASTWTYMKPETHDGPTHPRVSAPRVSHGSKHLTHARTETCKCNAHFKPRSPRALLLKCSSTCKEGRASHQRGGREGPGCGGGEIRGPCRRGTAVRCRCPATVHRRSRRQSPCPRARVGRAPAPPGPSAPCSSRSSLHSSAASAWCGGAADCAARARAYGPGVITDPGNVKAEMRRDGWKNRSGTGAAQISSSLPHTSSGGRILIWSTRARASRRRLPTSPGFR